jgi:hypothetical protein
MGMEMRRIMGRMRMGEGGREGVREGWVEMHSGLYTCVQ